MIVPIMAGYPSNLAKKLPQLSNFHNTSYPCFCFIMHNGGGMNHLFVPVVLLLIDAMLFWNASLWVLTFDPNIKAAVLQMLKKIKKNIKINCNYWSSYVQWRNLLLLTTNSVDKIVGKHSVFFLHIRIIFSIHPILFHVHLLHHKTFFNHKCLI